MGRNGGTRWLPWMALLLLTVAGGGCALTGVSEEDEIRLGKDTAAEVERQYRTYEDATVTDYGRRLSAVSERPNLPYRYRVIEMKEINAFALPGGPVYVTSGMMAFTRDYPEQLAAVLGHETAHIARRHAVQQIQRQSWLGLGIDILLGGGARDIAVLAANIEELGFSRNQERDADTHGAVYLNRIGIDPMAEVHMLERLGAQSGGGGISFLQTHPSSADRVKRLTNEIQDGEIARLARE